MQSSLLELIQVRIFTFGDYASHAYGCLCFALDGSVRASFPHERESFYRTEDGFLELLYVDARAVTARFVLVRDAPMLFHGSSVGLNNRLYLSEALAFDNPAKHHVGPLHRPAVLINSVPKSGTYFLQRAFQEMGYAPTHLHLGNTTVHDNRSLAGDATIHSNPRLHEVSLATGLLPFFLSPGSVTVGHIDDLSVLTHFRCAHICVIAVVRDLRAILWSLYRFKVAVVDPVDDTDRRWRTRSSHLEKFMGFLAYHLTHDLVHISNCFRSFASLADTPVLRYEDLVDGALSQATHRQLDLALSGCGGAAAFLAAVSAAHGAPTPTLTSSLAGLPELLPSEEAEIRRLIDAVVAGSALGELNALFGYR